MAELVFVVESCPEGGYIARALGQSIFTCAESIEDLRTQITDAIDCHFEDESDKHCGVRLQWKDGSEVTQ